MTIAQPGEAHLCINARSRSRWMLTPIDKPTTTNSQARDHPHLDASLAAGFRRSENFSGVEQSIGRRASRMINYELGAFRPGK